MSPLSAFIIVIIAITFQFSLYTLRRLQEPFNAYTGESNAFNKKTSNKKYWANAELTNGRLAMMGLTALMINYGLFGWIIPGLF